MAVSNIAHEPEDLLDQVQVSDDRNTVWVFGLDGSTVGRFSKTFGLDVHTTITEQLAGARECIHCTHTAPGHEDWLQFVALMREHYKIDVPPSLVTFEKIAEGETPQGRFPYRLERPR